MSGIKRQQTLVVWVVIAAVLLLAWPAILSLLNQSHNSSAVAQQPCQELFEPKDLPAPSLIDFDTLPNATLIGNNYRPSFGVVFEDSRLTHTLIYGNEPGLASSPPNVATNVAVSGTSAGVPMRVTFDTPKSHVGFYMGNGDGQIEALLTAYDSQNNFICQIAHIGVPDAHREFIGIADPEGRIKVVTLDYGQSVLSEAIDDLYFSPRPGAIPTRTPMPTWTPIPTALPTMGPPPTPTAIVPMMSYNLVVPVIIAPVLQPDFALHGIEITQGIQCFDPSKGLSSVVCADNSLPVVTKKDATARIYIKANNSYSGYNNVPVRLHIRANGVWYTANSIGKATNAIDQTINESANIYFNVNFTNDVVVDFYAEVDPDNNYAETNESNNRYPNAGFLTFTFRRRDSLKIVGQRLYYHPSGYSGSQYAGGWAVSGGAADWFEQMLPIRNNAVNYTIKSGYLNWTKSLSSDTNQHDLIKTLNSIWILENAFSFWFTGAFTGADHVYGWAPNDGYTGGHADMPVYPHAGGLGRVGIGSDRSGTGTDNPGGGSLIFGHELVHDYNVYHTNTSDACGSNDGNSNFPYGSSNIQEVGFNPLTGKIYDPVTTHDLMSYCPSGGSKQGWISPFTWSLMFNKFSPVASVYQMREGPVSAGVFHLTNASDALVVNATLFNPDLNPPVQGELGDLYKITADIAIGMPQGNYAIELRNVDDQILAEHFFNVNFESEYDAHVGQPNASNEPPPFPPDPTSQVDVSFIIPWVDGATSVALTLAGEVLDQRFISGNPPQVFITNPTQVEAWALGSTHILEWQGLDLDGDPLTYTISYSYDSGASWTILQGQLTEEKLDINVNDMAGGSDVRFRVVATDGLNTGMDETDQAITIPNQLPQATILNPAPGEIHKPGTLVVLQGYGTDFEDGGLADSNLTWSSDLVGGLGIGPSVPLDNLVSGEHTITLTAVDSYGATTNTTVKLTIAFPTYLPGLRK